METSRANAHRRNSLHGLVLLLVAPSLVALAGGCEAQVLPVEIDGVEDAATPQRADGGDSAASAQDAGQDGDVVADSTVDAGDSADSASPDATMDATMDSASSDAHVDVVGPADSGVHDTSSPPVDSSHDAPETAFVDTGEGDADGGMTGSGDARFDGAVLDSATDATDAATYTVGGTISGLATPESVQLTLQADGTQTQMFTTNGSFAFAGPVAPGTVYTVTATGQPDTPVSQTCAVVTGTGMGTVGTENVTTVAVTCTPNAFTIGVQVSGLPAAALLVLQDDGGDDLMVSANGTSTFSTPVPSGQQYDVTVEQESPGVSCSVTNGTGVVGANNVSVTVTCLTLTAVTGTLTWDNAPGPSNVTVQLAGDPTDGTSSNFTASAMATEGTAANGSFETPITFTNSLPPGTYEVSYPGSVALSCCVASETTAGTVTLPPFDVDVYCGFENLTFTYPNGSSGCTFTVTEPGGNSTAYGGTGQTPSNAMVPEGTQVHCNTACTLTGPDVVCGSSQTSYVIQCQ